MPQMVRLLVRFVTNEDGATAIEYSMLAAGVALAIAATVWSLGPKLNDSYSSVSNAFN
jgi:pilus assembly protein Flp/PilA